MADASEERPELLDQEDEDIPPEFECSICMKLLLDPVTVSCGHTFCRVCLEKSLGYRGVCAVCRAPVAAGQGVNILVRGIVAGRFPRALARRHREAEEELHAQERQADEARRREALGAADDNVAGDRPAAGAGAAAMAATAFMPLVEGLSFGGAVLLPHCMVEVELRNEAEVHLVDYALQGGRRIGAIDGVVGGAFDAAARPLGICFEIENFQRGTSQRLPLARLAGKYRFRLVEPPQEHEGGFSLGRCEAFFDEALPTRDLAPVPPEAPAVDAQAGDEAASSVRAPAPEVARSAMALLEAQLGHVGQGGRRVFLERFGDLPPTPALGRPCTSAALERLSFFVLGALITNLTERSQWLRSRDTRARLEHCCSRLQAAGSRPVLNLPGARSWMSPGQSAFSSFALLVGIVALFVAKALGLLEPGALTRLVGGSWQHGEPMSEAFDFG
mmetsp:Transcript_59553/g.192676  ORF Transcript_59553/g.192676 Transcript_59553/m.192676 type:complete len:446 (+) Transcript_59553:57-1394(+)|eukprot:CAMPEP_0203910156 /NCGR_PEP_ID=MMETSP0359-20131031/51397_1 /ASSEMBLY_ACC=CAM_ASM_000338 /TAXON_ID=268821 /ORGANISM="Scrippsiella Hangoei, Strain SHTV-5" /LENGTH=445 /DNA_ID=CAMNT_0050835557 /DNA_START=48 /DNA_END=1385 /DNA_ORIENTATION=-